MHSFGAKKITNVKGHFTEYYQSKGGEMIANLITMAVLSVQTTCKLEGAGGKKSRNIANVIYECPLVPSCMNTCMGSCE